MSATGVLLLGGLSRRFGSVKALAQLGPETLAERGWRVLGEAFEHRLAVGKAADQLGLPFEVVDDGVPMRAPISGVVGGLRAAETDVAVFLPVDCPLVSVESLRLLADSCVEAAVPAKAALPAAYAKTALPLLDSRLAAGDLDLAGALNELEARIVEVPEDELVSVNTERELERVRGQVAAQEEIGVQWSVGSSSPARANE
jgi:molybdopterin-guanine dinucleotide biosynthesis protein A